MPNLLKDLNLIKRVRTRSQHSTIAKSNAVLKLYGELDTEIANFKKRSGLKCITDCSICCESHKVEATTLELLPLAIHLCNKEKGEYWLNKAKESKLSGVCIFYESKPSSQNKGNCSIYRYRPLVCRLFGFSAIVDKNGSLVLQTCAKIKNNFVIEYKNVQVNARNDIPIPRMVNFTNKLMGIEFTNGVKQLPINQAIADSIGKVLLRKGYL